MGSVVRGKGVNFQTRTVSAFIRSIDGEFESWLMADCSQKTDAFSSEKYTKHASTQVCTLLVDGRDDADGYVTKPKGQGGPTF